MKDKIQELKEAFKKFRYNLAYLIAPDWIDDLEYRFSVFLCNQTGKLSKCYYSVDTMIRAANEYQQSTCEQCEYYRKQCEYYCKNCQYYIKCTKERENENVSTEEL